MRSIDGEVVQRKRCPSYNLSVSLRLDSSPGRGAFGIEEREVSKFMDSEKVIKRDNDYVLHTYNRNPIALEKGHGLYAEGPEGQKYLDFTSGIGVNSLGYCDVDWAEAVSEQAHKLQHTSNLYYTAPCGKLAKKLCKRTGMSKVFFGNSGAEANEGAIKAARKYSVDHYGKDRTTVITLVNSFHGRTIATLTATGQEVFHNYFGPFNEGFLYAPAGDIEALKDLIDRHTCAVMLELIQGEGGVLPLDPEFVKGVEAFCKEEDLLLIVDEVQTGIGRTGAWFAFQREDLSGGVTPDIVTFAKGVGGGFPMGGMISFGAELSALFTPGSHGSTFAGNPLGASAALATLGVIEEDNLVDNAEERGKQLRDGIASCGNPLFVSVRGRGLLDAIELAHPCSHAAMNWALEHGLIVNAVAPNALRLAPPLVITAQDVDQAVSILAKIPSDLPND